MDENKVYCRRSTEIDSFEELDIVSREEKLVKELEFVGLKKVISCARIADLVGWRGDNFAEDLFWDMIDSAAKKKSAIYKKVSFLCYNPNAKSIKESKKMIFESLVDSLRRKGFINEGLHIKYFFYRQLFNDYEKKVIKWGFYEEVEWFNYFNYYYETVKPFKEKEAFSKKEINNFLRVLEGSW